MTNVHGLEDSRGRRWYDDLGVGGAVDGGGRGGVVDIAIEQGVEVHDGVGWLLCSGRGDERRQ